MSMEYEYLTPAQSEPSPRRELTIGQQIAVHMCNVLADDLDTHHASRTDQDTAAILHLVADAIERGYEADLVAMVRTWRMQREREGV